MGRHNLIAYAILKATYVKKKYQITDALSKGAESWYNNSHMRY
jgi:hypothetical protein